MSKKSAGLLLFRYVSGHLEVLLAHPGGPYWARKDEGAWSIPKGELEENEDPKAAARREFEEEIGMAPSGDLIPLGWLRQPGGKVIHVWAVKGDFDPTALKSNTFSMEWPPKSGKQQEFPEVDRAEWLSIEAGQRKILKGQAPFLLQLQEKVGETQEASEGGPSVRRDDPPLRQRSLFDEDE